MMRPNGVEKQIRPKARTPGANTIAYFPLVDNLLDAVGSTSITYDITPVQQSIGYRFSADNNPSANTITIAGANFYSGWVKFNSENSVHILFFGAREGYIGFQFNSVEERLKNKFFVFYNSSLAADTSEVTGINIGEWHHICYGNDNGTWKFYVDGSPFFTATHTPYNSSNKMLLYGAWNSTDTADISDIIIESVCWTAIEISNYYDQTKASYGIS